jgi:PilZ domain-containing protein
MLLIAQPKTDRSNAAAASAEAVPSERRRGLRIHQNRPLKVFEPTTARFFGGQTCDISSTGLRIELPPFMPVSEGTVVSIHVGLNEKGQALANRRSMIPARIVWIERSMNNANKPQVMAGVEFVASIAAHLDAA